MTYFDQKLDIKSRSLLITYQKLNSASVDQGTEYRSSVALWILTLLFTFFPEDNFLVPLKHYSDSLSGEVAKT